MIEKRHLKNVVSFAQTILSFVLSRKIINIYNDIARKYRNVAVTDFRKYEKLECKKNKLKLEIEFLNSCKQLDVYPKFLIFKLPNVSNKYALSIAWHGMALLVTLEYAKTSHLKCWKMLEHT